MTTALADAPRRVLFISSTSSLYGGEYSLLHVVQRLDPARWEPRFVVPGDGTFAERLRDAGYAVAEFDVRAGLGQGRLDELRTAIALAWLIRRSRAELVHLNLHFAWPIVSAACLLARVPLVLHVRNMIEPDRRGPVDRFLFRRIPSFIAISEAVRERLLANGLADQATAARITLIPDGRDLAQFRHGNRAKLRRELGLAEAAPLIGMVARLEPMKGQDIFLEAARLVAERLPEARFVLVGDLSHPSRQAFREQLERLAQQSPLAGRVTFLGYRDDIPDVLAALDCFVHSSRRGAFVSVLIEAMAAGVPIVATDVDGIPECLGRDGAAELVAGLEPADFAAAMLRVVTDPGGAASMRLLATARASALFDVEPLARDTAAVLTRAAGASG